MNEAQTQHLHMPLHAEPAATYGINPPSSPPKPPARPWPLAARLALAVLIAALAAGLALSLVMLNSVSATATRASREASQLTRALGQAASQNGGSVAQLSRQLSAVQAQVGAIPPGLSHFGVCLTTWTNNATGSLSNMTLSPPVVKGNGVYTCPSGIFVSVVPVPGN